MGFLDKLFSKPRSESGPALDIESQNEQTLKARQEKIDAERPYDKLLLVQMAQRSGSSTIKFMLVMFGMGNIMRGVGFETETREPIQKTVSTPGGTIETHKRMVDKPVSFSAEFAANEHSGWAPHFNDPTHPKFDHKDLEKIIEQIVPHGTDITDVSIETIGYASPDGPDSGRAVTAGVRAEHMGQVADKVGVDGVNVKVSKKAEADLIRWTDGAGNIVEGKKADFLKAQGLSDAAFQDLAFKINRGKLSKAELKSPTVKAVQDMLRQSRVEVARIKVGGIEHKVFEETHTVIDGKPGT